MAVTLTVAELAGALRVGDSAQETTEMTRLLAYTAEAVARHAPQAPPVVADEAAIRLAGYLYDMPDASRYAGHGDPLRNSGAARILLPYRIHRAGNVAEAVGIVDLATTGEQEDTMATTTSRATAGHVDVGETPVDITRGLDTGTYQGHPFSRGGTDLFGVVVAYSANPPADPADYFYIRPGDSFDFTVPGPVWVRTDSGQTSTVAIVRVVG